MRTIELKIYPFDELSQEAKEKAREWYRNDHYRNQFLYDEANESLKAFADYYPIQLLDWSISLYDRSYVRFRMTCEPEVRRLKGVRLWKYLKVHYPISSESCPLTGVCYDESLLGPLREFMARPDRHTDFLDLMQACVDHWKKSLLSELEYRETEEFIDEEIQANEYEFLEDGTIYVDKRVSVPS